MIYDFDGVRAWLLFVQDGQLKKTKLPKYTNCVGWVEKEIERYREYVQAKAENRDPNIGYEGRLDLGNMDKEGTLADYASGFEASLAHAENEDAAVKSLHNSHQLFIGA